MTIHHITIKAWSADKATMDSYEFHIFGHRAPKEFIK